MSETLWQAFSRYYDVYDNTSYSFAHSVHRCKENAEIVAKAAADEHFAMYGGEACSPAWWVNEVTILP